ncbi:unnamed protein product [Polarella glacialis]|uniref:BART domain-containing protein n=1 Tax=Polarella glacialis TaxID=89957 RepID=A0A813M0A5_POLGL|nr:unnamed protein product [Polarella glacialis]
MSVLDGLAGYLEENDSLLELEGFVRQHCSIFPESEEQTHECFSAFQAYEALVRQTLGEFLVESRRFAHLVGLSSEATVESLVVALRDESAVKRPDMPGRMLRALLAITSYEEYAAESRLWRRKTQTLRTSPCLAGGPAATETAEVDVTVPDGVAEGQLLSVEYGGMRYEVPVPSGCSTGAAFGFSPPGRDGFGLTVALELQGGFGSSSR